MKNMKICFVILHYMDDKITIECIDSILKNIEIDDFKIIVVDNASDNNSYKIMKEYYGEQNKIDWIRNEKNLGFSRGNNIGYKYAKGKYNPEFIVVGNNDLEFFQKNFVSELIKQWEQYHFHVAGPDIITLDGIHQNPHRTNIRTYEDVKKKNRNKKLLLEFLKIKNCIPVIRNIGFPENIYFAYEKKIKAKKQEKCSLKNIVLHGACVIFSKNYISEQDEAFPEYTFMYMEEDILALRCQRENYVSYYLPELQVKHKEKISTKKIRKNELEKNIFVISEGIKAGNAYISLLKKSGKI